MAVHTAVEGAGCVFSQGAFQQALSAWMLCDVPLDVVDDARDDDEVAVGLGLADEVALGPHGQFGQFRPPLQHVAPSVQLLLLLLHQCLLDGVGGERLQAVRHAHQRAPVDEQLRRVVLVPFDRVSVVRWELVVEVVVTLAEGHNRGHPVVPWSSLVVKGLCSDVMRHGVDAERGLLDHENAHDARVQKAAEVVAEQVAARQGGDHKRHDDHQQYVVSVLEADDPVVVQVLDVGAGLVLGVGFQQHPAHVRVPQALSGVVGVAVGVGVAVVDTVGVAPPFDGALHAGGAEHGHEQSQRPAGGEGAVRPQAVVAGCDGDTAQHVVQHREECDAPGKRHQPGEHQEPAQRGHAHHEKHVQPVQVCVPVGEGPRLLGNVLGAGGSAAAASAIVVFFHVDHLFGAHEGAQTVDNAPVGFVQPGGNDVRLLRVQDSDSAHVVCLSQLVVSAKGTSTAICSDYGGSDGLI